MIGLISKMVLEFAVIIVVLELIDLSLVRKKRLEMTIKEMILSILKMLNQSSMCCAEIASLNMQAQTRLLCENGSKSQQNFQNSTHRNFIMSRFQRIT